MDHSYSDMVQLPHQKLYMGLETLKELTALFEDLSSVPSICVRQLITANNLSSRESDSHCSFTQIDTKIKLFLKDVLYCKTFL